MTIENNCGFEFKTIPIESTIIEQVKEAEDVVATGTGVHGLAKKWTSFAEFKGAFTRMSKTSQEDILAQLRMLALRKMAVQENCHALFLGDNSTHIAIQTISLVSKGRGFSLPIDTAKETSWFKGTKGSSFPQCSLSFSLFSVSLYFFFTLKDVIVNRPLREILTKELALFNYWEGINPVYRPSSSSFPKSSTKTSIGKLTKGRQEKSESIIAVYLFRISFQTLSPGC